MKNRLLSCKKKKRKTGLVILAFLLASIFFNSFLQAGFTAYAESDEPDAAVDLGKSVEDILEIIDISEFEAFLSTLDSEQKSLFGSGTALEKIKRIISGEMKIEYGSFINYFFSIAGINILRYLPMIAAILAITIMFSILSSIKTKMSSDSVENIVHFAALSLVIVIILSQLVPILNNVRSMIDSMKTQMNIVFPIILTMMAASGAGTSAAVYQPAVAILASGITEVMTLIILPFFILSAVFTIVGSLSEGVKLKKMSEFFSSASKWFLSTLFLVFGAFLSVQGITASVFDGVSVRTAKFAVSKYVPIIGGYLSEGLNLVMAGSVLVKNAVGMTGVILLFLTLVPVLAQIVIFNLSLSLAGAVAEPLGGGKISSLLSGLAKSMSMLIAVVLGTAFIYFIFLILVITTGNMVL